MKPIDPMTGKVIRERIHFSEIASPSIIVHAGAICVIVSILKVHILAAEQR